MTDAPPDSSTTPDGAGPERIEASVPLGDPDSTPPDKPSEASLQKLVTVVLDSASVANRSASVAATSTENLLNAIGDLGQVTKTARTNAWTIIGTSAGCGLFAIGTFIWASASLSGRLVQTDQTLQVAGKRVGELNAGVERLQRIETLLESQARPNPSAVESRIAGLEERIESLMNEIRKGAAQKAVSATAAQPDDRQQALLNQIRSLESALQVQSKNMVRLSEQVAGVKSEMASLSRTTSSIEAQWAQDQARNQQRAASQPAPRIRDRREDPRNPDFIQYPDPAARKSETPRP